MQFQSMTVFSVKVYGVTVSGNTSTIQYFLHNIDTVFRSHGKNISFLRFGKRFCQKPHSISVSACSSAPVSGGFCAAEDDVGDIVIGKVLDHDAVIMEPDADVGDHALEPVRFLHSISGGGGPIFDQLAAIGEVVDIDIVFFGKSIDIGLIVGINFAIVVSSRFGEIREELFGSGGFFVIKPIFLWFFRENTLNGLDFFRKGCTFT